MKDFLKRNKKIHYILKALKHINDSQYVEDFLNMESDPRLVRFFCKGDLNKEKAIYVITPNGKGWGYFAEFRALLCKLIYAERMGFVPYITWKDRDFLYYDETITDIDDAFNYFFEQNTEFTQEVINNSFMVAMSKSADPALIERQYKNTDTYGIDAELFSLFSTTVKKHIKLRADVLVRFEKQFNDVKNDSQDKILGVHFRGTDYRQEYDIHPVFVQTSEEVNKAKIALNKHGFNKIFLATDEKDAIDRFIDAFGEDKIIYYKDVVRGTSQESVAFSKLEREHHKYQLGYEVVRDMWTLSMCDGLIASVSQVATMARVFKASRDEEYEYTKIIDKGINHNNNKFDYKKR